MYHVAQMSPRRVAGLILVAVVAVGSLHLVRPNRETHGYSAPLIGPLRYHFNFDSAAFARIVVRFPRGLVEVEQGRTRLSRPLYPALAWVVYQPLRLLKPAIPEGAARRVADKMADANHPEIWRDIDPRDVILAWAALVLVNISIYVGAVWLTYRALARLFDPRAALALAWVPLVHFNTIDFVLVPHSEPFNVLLPAVFLYAATAAWERGRAGLAPLAALGIAVLGKGIFYPFVNWAYEIVLARPHPKRWRLLAASAALFLLPLSAYLAILRLMGVEPFIYEMEQPRLVVWMGDVFRDRGAPAVLTRLGWGVGLHLYHVALTYAAPLLVSGVAFLVGPRRPPISKALWRHLAVFAIAGTLFWAVVGIHAPRLAVCQFPLVVVLLGAAASERWIYAAHGLALAFVLSGLYG